MPSDQTRPHTPDLDRRTVLRGLALTGAAGASLLAGCGGSDSGQEAGSGGRPIAKTGDIPVGGGTVFAGEEVVVTQPKAGEFMAFSAICTHQACPLDEVADGSIVCPCHGSRFAIEDASVQKRPATDPLEQRSVTIEGDQVVVA